MKIKSNRIKLSYYFKIEELKYVIKSIGSWNIHNSRIDQKQIGTFGTFGRKLRNADVNTTATVAPWDTPLSEGWHAFPHYRGLDEQSSGPHPLVSNPPFIPVSCSLA